jgi:hypothetical protein
VPTTKVLAKPANLVPGTAAPWRVEEENGRSRHTRRGCSRSSTATTTVRDAHGAGSRRRELAARDTSKRYGAGADDKQGCERDEETLWSEIGSRRVCILFDGRVQ